MKVITHLLGRLAGPLIGLLWIAPSITGNAQTESLVSVDALDYFSSYDLHEMEKPKWYALAEPLTLEEIHMLDTLSDQERIIIEASTDPPAIGILRDLRSPVHFTTGNLPALDNGELSVAGGRLSRISKNLLVWTSAIRSKGADEIRILFSEGNFPPGVRVNLFGRDDFAFTMTELTGQISEYGYFTPTVFDDQVIIQVIIPAGIIMDNLNFTIPQIIHADYRYIPQEGYRDCYEDVNCTYANTFSGISSLKQSTARLLFLEGSSYYLCTGGLLNDSRSQDFQPFLLTANHCFDTQVSANSLEARFDYYTTSCNGSTSPDYIIVNGSNLIATNSQSDFTLVLLKNNPGGTRTYLGWTTASVDNDATLHSVHHPGGTPQKYTRHQNKTSPSFTCSGLSISNFHYTKGLGGQIAGGSSGGSMVLPDLKVVGQLYGYCYSGTYDPCNYSNFYNVWGKFGVSYNNNNLQYWLYGGGSSVAMTTTPSATLDFGSVNVGNYLDKTVTVTNSGTVPNYLNLEAGDVTLSGTSASEFSIIGSTFLYLSPGQSGNFTIRFTPSSDGSKTATLNIPHNADNISSPRTISLTGTGGGEINPCSNVIAIGGCGSGYSKTFTGGGSGAWFTSEDNPCGYTTPGIEQVYSFVAPATGTYSIQVTAASGWVDYLWRASSCSPTGWACISDISSSGQYGSLSWTAGTTYYILLDDEDSNTGTHTFYFNCPLPPAPDINVLPTSLTIYEPETMSDSNQVVDATDQVQEVTAQTQEGAQRGSSTLSEIDSTQAYVLNDLVLKFFPSIPISFSISPADNSIKTGDPAMDEIFRKLDVNEMRPIYTGKSLPDELANTFLIHYRGSISLSLALSEVRQIPSLEWVNLNYLYPLDEVPNDPQYSQQWYLPLIDAPDAWDVGVGSSGVSIGIIDTGVDWDHPDLSASIWINDDEIPGNGVDDDSNGYTDDIRGWDWVDNTSDPASGEDGDDPDNNPMDFNGHGTHCSGLAAATTNNSTGIASISHGCKIMCLRAGYEASSGTGYIQYAAAASAIQYAIDNGARVVSMSFGGGSALLTSVINAYNNNIVVCHSAGNANSSTGSPIDGIEQTITVAATNQSDVKASFSNYGTWVDVSAPGVTIYSTYFNDTYVNLSGTSMSTPIVAGLAGLLISQNPSRTAAQITSIIKSSADNIDGQNPGYAGLLGTGRINAYAAISQGSVSQFVIQNVGTANLSVTSITDNKDWLSTTGYPGTPFTILPAGSQNVGISVNWTLVGSAQQTGTVTVASNDPDEPSVTVQVTAVPDTPPVDPCSGIISMGGCGSSNTKTYTGGGTGIWFNSVANPCGHTSPGIEQIYSFVAPYTGTYSIQVTAASGAVDYLWRPSSCASTGWACIDDISSAGQYGSMSWSAGTTYYILLDDENSTSGTHTFYMNCPVICKECPAYDYTLIPSDEWNNHTAFHFAEGCILYRISVISGNKYFFKTGCGDGALATYNTYLALYNESCDLLTSNDDGCEMNRSVVEWTSTYTGYAYLKVSGNDDVEYGQFTLAYMYVPAVLTLQNITVPSGQIICNEALQSIIVAGGGTYYIISSGADVTMVAGEQILLKPGFHALQGSHFHAWISDQGCSEPTKPVAVITAEDDQLDEQHADAERLLDADNPLTTGGYLKIYPNPTTGRLVIEISPADPFELTRIHVYDFQGRMLSQQENISPGMTEMDLGAYPNGIYLIRVMCANRLDTVKVVKQD